MHSFPSPDGFSNTSHGGCTVKKTKPSETRPALARESRWAAAKKHLKSYWQLYVLLLPAVV